MTLLEGRSRRGAGRERAAGPGHVPLLGPMGGALWASWTQVGLVHSNPIELGLGELHRGRVGVWSKGCTRERL